MTGLTNVRYQDMDAWSQAMIEGIANYGGDPEVEQRCNAATAAIDAAIDDVLPVVRRVPDHSLLSVMLEGGLSEAQARANIKLTISGGQNEPRKAIAGTIWALLTHPDALSSIGEGRATWMQAFDELTRWISPIGMSPRRVAKPWTVDGVGLEVDDRVFLMFGSANRDETHFADADRFDIARNNSRSRRLRRRPALLRRRGGGAVDGRGSRAARCVQPPARASARRLRRGAHRGLGVPRAPGPARRVGRLARRRAAVDQYHCAEPEPLTKRRVLPACLHPVLDGPERR